MAEEPPPQTPPLLRLEVQTGEHEDGLSAFAPVRPRLFGIAYRMLGSAAEAEDVVQDVWMRWQSTNRKAVENPAAFLATTTTRLCINLAQSAHTRRETYIGTWLPEPVDTSADPGVGAERGEAIKLAVLLLLEKLSPTERAAYVLREAFDYPYDQIASILQMGEANVRQLVSRARKHIADGRRTSAVWASSGAFWRPSSVPPKRETWPDWNISSLRMLSHTQMAGTGARSGSPSFRPRACSNVYCRCLHMVLEGRDTRLGRDKWTSSCSDISRRHSHRAYYRCLRARDQ
jgi:RNA polymerase sigma factor (sigma-70 family)